MAGLNFKSFCLLYTSIPTFLKPNPAGCKSFHGLHLKRIIHFSQSGKESRKMLLAIRNPSILVEYMNKEAVQDTVEDLSVSGDAIRQCFLNFYSLRGHKILSSASLLPDDPTVLLTITAMLQFKPIFLGKMPRHVSCATTAQRCIRKNDVDNVGKTSRHQTFFEMLRNFRFGDYFKREAINWAWELTTKEYAQNLHCQ